MATIDPAIKAQFDTARELITLQRYDEARAVLKTIRHPAASKWLTKLDELDPSFPAPSKPRGGCASYEADLQQWVEVEKTLIVVGALGLVLLAAFLWLADPFRKFLTFLLFDKPVAREVVIHAMPVLCILIALFGIWRSTQDAWMRRQVLKMKPRQLRVAAVVLFLGAVFSLLVGPARGEGSHFSWAISGLLLMMLNLWRAAKVEKLREYDVPQ